MNQVRREERSRQPDLRGSVHMDDEHARKGLAPQVRRTLGVRLRTERARPDRIRLARNVGWLAVGTVCFGAFMGMAPDAMDGIVMPVIRSGRVRFRQGAAAASLRAAAEWLVSGATSNPASAARETSAPISARRASERTADSLDPPEPSPTF